MADAEGAQIRNCGYRVAKGEGPIQLQPVRRDGSWRRGLHDSMRCLLMDNCRKCVTGEQHPMKPYLPHWGSAIGYFTETRRMIR